MFKIYSSLFSIFSEESIRSEYAKPQNAPVLTAKQSFCCDACLCNSGIQTQHRIAREFTVYCLCYSYIGHINLPLATVR